MQLFRVMEQGNLVPDEEVVGLIKDAMAATSQDSKGYVLDGFPATMEQAKLFESKIGSPTKIIVFDVNDVVLMLRQKERSNFDDNPESIQKRLDTYTTVTKPVIKEYSKSVVTVNDVVLMLRLKERSNFDDNP